MLSCLIRLLSSESLGYKDKENRDKNEVTGGGRKHPPDDRCPDGGLGSRSGAGSYGQRQDAEEERHRGHDDRPKSSFYRPQGRLDQFLSVFHAMLCELNDQNGVFRGQSQRGEESDLKVNVVRHTGQPCRRRRAKDAQR